MCRYLNAVLLLKGMKELQDLFEAHQLIQQNEEWQSCSTFIRLLFTEVNPLLWIYALSLWLRYGGNYEEWLSAQCINCLTREKEQFMVSGAGDIMLTHYVAAYHNVPRDNYYVWLCEDFDTACKMLYDLFEGFFKYVLFHIFWKCDMICLLFFIIFSDAFN